MTSAKGWVPLALTKQNQVLFYQGAQVYNHTIGQTKDSQKDWLYTYEATFLSSGDNTTLELKVTGTGRTLDVAIFVANEKLKDDGWLAYVEQK